MTVPAPGPDFDRGAVAQAVRAIAASVMAGSGQGRRPSKGERIEMVAIASAARESLDETVEMARLEGASWGDNGAALGISRQAAFQRFGA